MRPSRPRRRSLRTRRRPSARLVATHEAGDETQTLTFHFYTHRDASKSSRRSGRRRRRRSATRSWPRRCTRRGWTDSSARRSATSSSTPERRDRERQSGHAEHHISLLPVRPAMCNGPNHRLRHSINITTPEERNPNALCSTTFSLAGSMATAFTLFWRSVYCV